ncbi:hypothetical protein D3C87_1072610 [compost metagenome]
MSDDQVPVEEANGDGNGIGQQLQPLRHDLGLGREPIVVQGEGHRLQREAESLKLVAVEGVGSGRACEDERPQEALAGHDGKVHQARDALGSRRAETPGGFVEVEDAGGVEGERALDLGPEREGFGRQEVPGAVQQELARAEVAPPDGGDRRVEDLAGAFGKLGQGVGRTEREVAERPQDLGATRVV